MNIITPDIDPIIVSLIELPGLVRLPAKASNLARPGGKFRPYK